MWEYKVMRNIYFPQLEELGNDRWELVSISFYPMAGEQIFYFKRPKINQIEKEMD